MNRDIKFRAWDNKEKKWLLGYEYPNLGGFSIVGECVLFGEWQSVINRFIVNQNDRTPDDLIIMQFTGLKDSNGTEIYEGDVLMYIGTHMSDMDVVFENGCFMGSGLFNKRPLIDYINAMDFQTIEVIGHIYEKDFEQKQL